MKKISALRMEEGRKKQVAVYFEGQRKALRLEVDTALKMGLAIGQVLTDEELNRLGERDHFYRAENAALHYLSYRPRSESEVKERLFKRGFTATEIDAVLSGLKEKGMLDDAAFAEFWKENRREFSPRSRLMTSVELAKKGVSRDVIESITGKLDDNENAYRAGIARARRIPTSDRNLFAKRLGDYLGRRGFGYGVVKDTVEKIWVEVGGVPGI